VTRQRIGQQDLEAYLDEALPAEEMAQIEAAIRADAETRSALAMIHSRRDSGVHSLGEIWRRHRLSCPTRQQLGSFLLNVLSAEETDYFRFHLEVSGCRFCQANLEDLQNQQRELTETSSTRRRRYFQSSAGLLRSQH
jgi:hypothetical protein